MNNKPFKNLKVVELASVLAGPSVGMFFAELGAKVIKIENPRTNGDVTRSWKLPTEEPSQNTSAYYKSVNWGKKSIFLDLTQPQHYHKLTNHLKTADVVITNYKRGDEKKLKVDYQTIKQINPSVIYAQIEGFPNSSRVAFDLVLQAETGFMSMNGNTKSGPLKMPIPLIDVLTAHQLKEAILIALLNKEKTGKGCKVSVSLFDAAITSLVNQAANYLIAGHIPQALGSLHPNIAPYGELFVSKDQITFTLAIGSDAQFKKLSELLNFRFKNYETNSLRIQNRKNLKKNLQAKFLKFNFYFLKQLFAENNIPYAEIKDLSKVLSVLPPRYFLNYKGANGKNERIVKSVAFSTS